MVKNSSTFEDGVTILGALVLIVIAVIVMPFICFCFLTLVAGLL